MGFPWDRKGLTCKFRVMTTHPSWIGSRAGDSTSGPWISSVTAAPRFPPDHLATVAEGVPDLAAATKFIMDLRKSGPLMLTGFSSGALRAALFTQHYPERVRRLALNAMVWTGANSPTLETAGWFRNFR